jgi:hypothetical protein
MQPTGTRQTNTTKRRTALIGCLALMGALLAMTPLAAAHESEEHGIITVHDEEDGPPASGPTTDPSHDLHCEFYVRGSGLETQEGEIRAFLFLGGPSAHSETLGNWSGEMSENGTFDFEAGPFSFDRDIPDLFIAGILPEDSNHSTPWVKVRFHACEDEEPEESSCPPDLELAAVPNDDGTVQVTAHGLTGEAELMRTQSGDAAGVTVAMLDQGNNTVLDHETEAHVTYEYALVVDGETCATLEVTAIPFFPGPFVVLAMMGAAVAAQIVLRRRH